MAGKVTFTVGAGNSRTYADRCICYPVAIGKDGVFDYVTLPGAVFIPRAVGRCFSGQQVVVLEGILTNSDRWCGRGDKDSCGK